MSSLKAFAGPGVPGVEIYNEAQNLYDLCSWDFMEGTVAILVFFFNFLKFHVSLQLRFCVLRATWCYSRKW